ncbi:MAG: hypothetical protein HY687_00170 [Chloroflexi bacterium]|nr:hypothetical protein [Chloroflexota bacterium]
MSIKRKGKRPAAAAANSKKCFVIMPLGDEQDDRDRFEKYNKAYEHVIEPAVREKGYTVERGGLSPRPGVITPEIVNKVYEADLVVADLTDGNPNVYYEIGIRHSYKKPIIHVCHRESNPTFDIHWQRTVFYDFDVQEVKKAVSEIGSQVEHLAKNPEDFDNPVSIASATFTLSSQNKALGVLVSEISRLSQLIRGSAAYGSLGRVFASPSILSGFSMPRETVTGKYGTEYGVNQAGRLVPVGGISAAAITLGDYSLPAETHIGKDGRRYGTLENGRLVELV